MSVLRGGPGVGEEISVKKNIVRFRIMSRTLESRDILLHVPEQDLDQAEMADDDGSDQSAVII